MPNEIVLNTLWESDTVVSLIRFAPVRPSYSSHPDHADLLQFVTATGGELLDDKRNQMGTAIVELFRRLTSGTSSFTAPPKISPEAFIRFESPSRMESPPRRQNCRSTRELVTAKVRWIRMSDQNEGAGTLTSVITDGASTFVLAPC